MTTLFETSSQRFLIARLTLHIRLVAHNSGMRAFHGYDGYDYASRYPLY